MQKAENDWQFVHNMPSFTPKEIQDLFRTARRIVKDSSCDFLIAPRQASQARLLVITSRKVGNAPERNKVRRRLKAIFYEEKLFERSFDCIIIVKKAGALLPFDQWKQLLLSSIPPLCD